MADSVINVDKEKILQLLKLPLFELISLSNSIRKEKLNSKLDVCSIINVRSGICSEDCKFCAQSSHYQTEIDSYPLKEKDIIIKAAQRAKDIGAERFGLVASGKKVTERELDNIADVITIIQNKIGIELCASLGVLSKDNLKLLKEAGLSRYHHNIETSPLHFSKICTTHKFEDRINTLKFAKQAELEVCSGGIIGMGEDWRDRIDMALLLQQLDVDSVPINILVPIKGTPLETIDLISCVEAIKTIALFRIILDNKIIKIAAGRESLLKDFQGLAFMSGANGMIVDGYLTIKGRDIKEDWRLIEEIKKVWQESNDHVE